jgi:magnesium transporter
MTHKIQRRKINHKVGLPPGTMVAPVQEGSNQIWNLELFVYDEQGFEECLLNNQIEFDAIVLSPDKVYWLNIPEITDTKMLQVIGEKFELHALVLEDVSNPEQRPKIEEYDKHLFYTLKMLHYEQQDLLHLEQVSIILGENYVLSFQEKPGDVFHPVRDRIRHKNGRVRRRKADYLAYALFDVVVDHYFILLDGINKRMETVDGMVARKPHKNTLEEIEGIRKDLLFETKAISPLKEAVAKLIRTQSVLISASTRNYFNDLQDNILEIIETLELNRQLNNSHRDMYFSALTHKMNEIMKGLTIVATIFIPLTFVVGIYGMNFDYMPELHMKNGYFTVLSIMAVIALGSVYYFKRKDWI